MGAVRSLNLGIKVNGKEVETTFNSVTKRMYELRREVNRTEEGTEDWVKANKELAVVEQQRKGMIARQREFRKEIAETTEETNKNKDAIQDFGQSFGQVTSGIISGDLIQVQEGLKGMRAGIVGATKASLAFIATPLGAVLAGLALAIGAVTQYFRDSEEGQNAWNKVTAVTSTLVGNFTDLISDLGALLIKVFSDPVQSLKDFGNLIKDQLINRITGALELIPGLAKAIGLAFKGEFAEAGKTAGDAIGKMVLGVEGATNKIADGFKKAEKAVRGFGKEVIDEAQRAAKLANMAAEADKIERALIVERGKVEAKVAEARLKARDEERYSAAERKEFLQEAVDLQNGLLDKEIEAASIRASIKTQQNEFSKSTKEDLDEEAQLIAKVDQLRRKKAEAERTMVRDQLRVDNELKKSRSENAKLQEAEDKKRIAALNVLEAEYLKKSLDRQKQTAVEQAELNKEQALQKAKDLGAEQSLLDQITAEHDAEIAEKKAEAEEEELQRIKEFEAKKRELENQLALERAETENEKAAIQEQIELEKEEAAYEKKIADFEKEMEFLELSEEEKNQLVEKLKEAHEAAVFGIKKKWVDKEIQEENRLNAEKKKLWNDSLNAAITAVGAETKLGQGLVLAKEILAAKEMAMELGLFQNKMTLRAAEASGDIAAGTAKTAAVGFPQNIPLLIAFSAQVAGIVKTIQNAGKAKDKVQTQGFARGGYTDRLGLGYRDESGEEVAGVVHTDEYIIPKFVRKDPEVPRIIEYLEDKRVRKLRGYATGGDTTPAGSADPLPLDHNSSDPRTNQLLELILEGVTANRDIHFGPEAEMKRQELQKKLENIRSRAKVKKD